MRARKLQEMTENVEWQAGEREGRAAAYKVKEAKELEVDSERKEATFMHSFAKAAYGATTSIADRINKNRHFVQTTAHELDKSSFAR
jgi:hypothetical protein